MRRRALCASASASPAGTTRLTRPKRSAVVGVVERRRSAPSPSRACAKRRGRRRPAASSRRGRSTTPGRAKRASIAGDREVAGGDELAARRGRDALDGGDHRLGQRDDLLHQLGAARHDAFVEGRPRSASLRCACSSLRSWPAESAGPSPARTTTRADGSASIAANSLDQRFDHRQAQRVARGRRLQRQRRDAAVILAAQQGGRVFVSRRGVHGGAPPSRPWRVAAGRGRPVRSARAFELVIAGNHRNAKDRRATWGRAVENSIQRSCTTLSVARAGLAGASFSKPFQGNPSFFQGNSKLFQAFPRISKQILWRFSTKSGAWRRPRRFRRSRSLRAAILLASSPRRPMRNASRKIDM